MNKYWIPINDKYHNNFDSTTMINYYLSSISLSIAEVLFGMGYQQVLLLARLGFYEWKPLTPGGNPQL